MKDKGITLIALVITIIVLLILVGVSLSISFGENGILNKAKKSIAEYSEAEVQEQIKLASAAYEMEKLKGLSETAENFIRNSLRNSLNDNSLQVSISDTTGEIIVETNLRGRKQTFKYNPQNGDASKIKLISEYPEIKGGTKAEENSRYISDGKTAIIPAGYTVSSETKEQSIDTGLVITKNGNEWVWIPVSTSDLATMYTEDNTGWTMIGTEIVTKYKSNGNIVSGLTRVSPGDTSSYREPDVLNDDRFDKKSTNLVAAGFNNYIDMATKLRNDYKEMIDSVRKYGGFYVGRYELSSAGTKKGEEPLTNTNWYNLYAACKSSSLGNGSVVPRMIWGCQWDQVCKFINTSGDKVSITDSRTYGNYFSSQSPANVTGYKSKQVTGYSEYWKVNNIYDLAGNCTEYTQEAGNAYGRTIRGGDNDSGSINVIPVVTHTYASFPTNTKYNMSSRPVLYLK